MTPATPRITRNDLLLTLLLVLVAFGIRLYFVRFNNVISADGISYVNIAKEFITGKGLASATHYPPFYPILLGLASTLTHDFETAGLAVSIIMGSLIGVPTYLLGAEFFNKRAGFIAAVLAITWPSLRYWSTSVMSQGTYITLLLFGIYFLWLCYKNSSWRASILAGAFFAAAHLTRSEGVLVLLAGTAVLLVFTAINRLKPRKMLYVLLCLVVFFLLFSPYLILLHDLTGKWQLTGKSRVSLADALSEYLGTPDIKHDPKFKELGYMDIVRMYPDYIRTNYLKNLKACWNDILPLYGWLLAISGLIAGAFNREKLFERAYLLATFAPLLVIITFFFIGPEYTQAYLPVLFLFIGNAITTFTGWGTAKRAKGSSAQPAGVYRHIPATIILLYAFWSLAVQLPPDRNKPYNYEDDGGRFDDKQVGQRLNKLLPENASLVTRSGRIGFYSGRRYIIPPQADFNGIIDHAKKNRAQYLIATVQLLNMRPQLEFLYGPILNPGQPFTPPPELELVTVGQEPGGLPYIVYKIK